VSELWEGLQEFTVFPGWLVVARDSQAVCQALRERVPEFSTGQLLLENCEIGHMRFKTEVWTGTYELHIREPESGAARVLPFRGTIYPPGYPVSPPFTVNGAFGSDSWFVDLPEINTLLASPEPEKVLTALEMLTDPELARSYLENSIRRDSPHYASLSIRSCEPRIVRYKPGSRCTILYTLDYGNEQATDNGWPNLVVAKTYRNEKGKNAFESMRALWESPLGRSERVAIAEGLAYDPELRVLIQGPIREEQTLKKLLISAISSQSPVELQLLEDYMQKTAVGLAELHRSGVQADWSWTWDEELGDVRDRIERLADAVPQIAHSLDPLLVRLKSIADAILPDALVPSHGSFRPAQVLVHHGQIGFIDFDSFSMSEPGLDLALFLSTVKSIGLDTSELTGDKNAPPLQGEALTARLDQMLSMSERFLQNYESIFPISRERVATWEALQIIMLIILSWVKVKTFRIDECLYLLEDHLRRMGV
jgi:hypothetical protein